MPHDIAQLQELLHKYMPFPNSMLAVLDVPDASSPADWVPTIHFDRRTLYRREGKGFRGVDAWVCDGVIVSAVWAGDIRNVPELVGRRLDEVLGAVSADAPARGPGRPRKAA